MSEEEKLKYIELKANEIKQYIEKQEQEIERLNNIIEEAIKWVKENQYYFPRPDELLKILRGSDKE